MSLKISSGIGTVLLLAVWYATSRGVPPGGITHSFGSIVTWAPPLLLLGASLLVVRGYDVDPSALRVQRLIWSDSISLSGLTRVWHDRLATKGSTRVFGNGGMFAFTGVYGHKTLGRYRLYATDPSRAVVLKLPERTIIVTPAEPEAFVNYLIEAFPALR